VTAQMSMSLEKLFLVILVWYSFESFDNIKKFDLWVQFKAQEVFTPF
jgi:hypothetical protein